MANKYKIYIIDSSSRQYPFDVPEAGLKLTIDGNVQTVTNDNVNLAVFNEAIVNKKPFILEGESGGIAFNTTTLTGVQIFKLSGEE